MGTVAQHRAAIKDNIETVLSATVRDYESLGIPSGIVYTVSWPDSFNPHADQGTARDIVYPVRFECPWGDDKAADDKLEAAMQSIVAAIESDPTLNGACDDLACGPFVDIGAVTKPDETRWMTFVVPVEVFD